MTLPGALNTYLTWTTGGVADWFSQSVDTKDGEAAQSGDISDSEVSWIETIVGPGILGFWWKVSSEDGYDFLKFEVNGNPIQSISGSSDWAYVETTLTVATNTCKWIYEKDSSESAGNDCGYLDGVTFKGEGGTSIFTPEIIIDINASMQSLSGGKVQLTTPEILLTVEASQRTVNSAAVTAKSVVFDIATGWNVPNNGIYTGVRSIEFKLGGVLIDCIAQWADFSAFSSGGSYPEKAFITTLSKIGSSGDGWLSSLWTNNCGRLIIVFTTPQEFDEIVINNYHNSGASTNYGIRNVTITITNETISNTTFGNFIPNSAILFQTEIAKHVELDVVDDQSLLVVLDNIVYPPVPKFSAKTVIFQFLDSHDTDRNIDMGIRSIDFYRNGTLLNITSVNCSADESSLKSTLYYARNAIYTALPKIGAASRNSWRSSEQYKACCLTFYFSGFIYFDEIIVTNYHDSGASTNLGVKQTKIWITNDASTNADLPNLTHALLIYFDDIAKHTEVDEIDAQKLLLGAAVEINTPEIIIEILPTCTIQGTPILTAYSAKSIVFDFADNHGSTEFMGIRSVGFWYLGEKLNILSEFTSYQTSVVYPGFSSFYIFNTSYSQIDLGINNSWTTARLIDQRLSCVFDTPITFDEIGINNYHSNGAETDKGIANVKITISPDTIDNATYGLEVTNGSLIFDGQFAQHSPVNLPDTQFLPLSVKGADAIISTPEILLGVIADSTVRLNIANPEIFLNLSVTSEVSIKEGRVLLDTPELVLNIGIDSCLCVVLSTPKIQLSTFASMQSVSISVGTFITNDFVALYSLPVSSDFISFYSLESVLSGNFESLYALITSSDFASSYALTVCSDFKSIYHLKPVLTGDIESCYALMVASDVLAMHNITVSSEIQSHYAIALISRDWVGHYNILTPITKDIIVPYILEANVVKNDILSTFALLVSNDTQTILNCLKLIINDTESTYNIFMNATQSFKNLYDISNVDKVQRDVLGIYTIFGSPYKILNVRLQVLLEGEYEI